MFRSVSQKEIGRQKKKHIKRYFMILILQVINQGGEM